MACDADGSVTRKLIIEALRSGLDSVPEVNAVWLEGADALCTVDHMSDIDLVVDVADGAEALVLTRISSVLSELGTLDYSSSVSVPTEGLRHQVFHVSGTARTLLIDAVVQSRSRPFVFTEGHPSETPLVLFDRGNVVRFKELDQVELDKRVHERASELVAEYRPVDRMGKYLERGLFLEALSAYWKYGLAPLVEMLRLKHQPLTHEYGLVHISRHLPEDVVRRLERLYAVRTVEDIGDSLVMAEEWFAKAAADVMDAGAAGQPAPGHSA